MLSRCKMSRIKGGWVVILATELNLPKTRSLERHVTKDTLKRDTQTKFDIQAKSDT